MAGSMDALDSQKGRKWGRNREQSGEQELIDAYKESKRLIFVNYRCLQDLILKSVVCNINY